MESFGDEERGGPEGRRLRLREPFISPAEERHREATREDSDPTQGEPGPLDNGQLVAWRLPAPPDAPPPQKRLPGLANNRNNPHTERVLYTEQLWRALYSHVEIIDIVSRRFGVSESCVRNDVRKISKRYMAEEHDPDVISSRKSQMRAKLTELEREARANNDRSTARYALDRLCKLDGLYAPVKVDVTSTVQTVGLEIEKVAAALDADGLAALEIVMVQLQRAGLAPAIGASAAVALPAGVVHDVPDPDDLDDLEDDDGDE